ncbi:MAG: hypothetical protein V1660_02995 [archaeon]
MGKNLTDLMGEISLAGGSLSCSSRYVTRNAGESNADCPAENDNCDCYKGDCYCTDCNEGTDKT